MDSRISISILISSFFFLLTLLGPVPVAGQTDPVSWPHVTVSTTSGTVFEDVTVAWSLAGYSLKITHDDGRESELRPSEVATIRNAAGQDITNTVAEANPATDVNFALIGDQRIIPFEFALMLTGGGSGAMYQAGGDMDPTWSIFGGARISLGSRIYVNAQYRRQRVVEPVHAVGGEVSTDTNELHMMVGFRVTHPRENNNYHYVELGVSVISFPERFNAERGTWNDRGGSGAGFTLQGGVVYPISLRVGLDLGGTFMLRPALIEDSGNTGLLLGINAALAMWW